MKILILTNNDGGLYSFRRELLERLISDGNDVFVSFPDGEFRSKIEQLGCKYIESKIDRRGMNPIKDIGLCFHFIELIKSIKPDVVLLYTVKPNVYGGIACQLMHVPYISTVTGLGTSIENPGVLQKLVITLYRLGLKKAFAVMFQNETNKNTFEKLHIGKNYRIVPGSGVNLEQHSFEEYPPETSAIRLTFVGRIMKDKGINELLEAAKIIKEEHPEVQFDLIGSFDESYQSIVDDAVKAGTVNYLGTKTDMHPYYKDSWAVVMPSYHEGLCNVCLEGASTGRPILASNVPGCIETFDDGITGFGFEAKSANSLVNAIKKIINLSYAEKRDMGIAGRHKMEKEFDRNVVISSYLKEIYNTKRNIK